MFVRTFVTLWQSRRFQEIAMKVEQGGPISLSNIEYILREAKAEAEIVAQMKRALESGDEATALDLARRLCQLPEEIVQ